MRDLIRKTLQVSFSWLTVVAIGTGLWGGQSAAIWAVVLASLCVMNSVALGGCVWLLGQVVGGQQIREIPAFFWIGAKLISLSILIYLVSTQGRSIPSGAMVAGLSALFVVPATTAIWHSLESSGESSVD